MSRPSLIIYGIPNCDTVRRARAWLAQAGVDASFHDFKKAGVPQARLDAWLSTLGWERLINRQGTTYRSLADARKAGVLDTASARDLMLELPSVIKRPVVDWPGGAVTVGFDADEWSRRLG